MTSFGYSSEDCAGRPPRSAEPGRPCGIRVQLLGFMPLYLDLVRDAISRHADICVLPRHRPEVRDTCAPHEWPEVLLLDLDHGDTIDFATALRLRSECATRILGVFRGDSHGSPSVAHDPAGLDAMASTDVTPKQLVDIVERLAAERALDAFALPAPARAAGRALSARQRQVLDLVAQGATREQIALELGLAVGTVHNHINRILARTGARNRIEAVDLAYRNGLLSNRDPQ